MKIRVGACALVLSGLLASVPSATPAWIDAVKDSSTRTVVSESTPATAPAKLIELTASEPLARITIANELLYSDLQNFVCNERIDRYKGPLSGAERRRIDTVTSKVSFENGVEHYTDIRQNNRPRPGITSLSGAWSEGEFGTLLRQTQAFLESKAMLFRMNTDINGAAATLYRFEVSEQDSPWDLEIESRHYHVPFRTDVWVSLSSGQILKIERTSTAIPLETGISELRWSVSLQTVELNGKKWLLPNTGEYEVLYEESNRREWNLLSFSDYHRYGSQVALSFDTK
jgi:hypothetical protein